MYIVHCVAEKCTYMTANYCSLCKIVIILLMYKEHVVFVTVISH